MTLVGMWDHGCMTNNALYYLKNKVIEIGLSQQNEINYAKHVFESCYMETCSK